MIKPTTLPRGGRLLSVADSIRLAVLDHCLTNDERVSLVAKFLRGQFVSHEGHGTPRDWYAGEAQR